MIVKEPYTPEFEDPPFRGKPLFIHSNVVTMLPKDQTTCLELSRKMNELGVKQESLFYITESGTILMNPATKPLKSYSSFTVGELGEMLPASIETPDEELTLMIEKTGEGWRVSYVGEDYVIAGLLVQEEEKAADACAKMFIDLIENGLQTL